MIRLHSYEKDTREWVLKQNYFKGNDKGKHREELSGGNNTSVSKEDYQQ